MSTLQSSKLCAANLPSTLALKTLTPFESCSFSKSKRLMEWFERNFAFSFSFTRYGLAETCMETSLLDRGVQLMTAPTVLIMNDEVYPILVPAWYLPHCTAFCDLRPLPPQIMSIWSAPVPQCTTIHPYNRSCFVVLLHIAGLMWRAYVLREERNEDHLHRVLEVRKGRSIRNLHTSVT